MTVITVTDIAYVRYQAPDLDRMEAFLIDFGMVRGARTERALHMRGFGTAPVIHVTELGDAPACLGLGLYAQSAADLEALAAHAGASVEDNPEPGGGRRVVLRDPGGLRIDILHGQAPTDPITVRAPIAMNPVVGRRRLGQVVRVPSGPSHAMRCGHVAMVVPDYAATIAFYTEVFGMRPSDTYFAGAPGNTVAAFLHCGLGLDYTDHHTIAVIAGQVESARFDHSAFEVIDLDDLMRGNEHLVARQRTHAWGVGRHIQGSQIFDYWRDPFGHKIEHWTDGDQVNDETPVGHTQLSAEELHQWAPQLNPEFFT